MITVQIRKQGGAAVVTIPAVLMNMLKLEIGVTLRLDITNGELVAKPVRRRGTRRYTLKELMRGATPKILRSIERDTVWFLERKALGREIV